MYLDGCSWPKAVVCTSPGGHTSQRPLCRITRHKIRDGSRKREFCWKKISFRRREYDEVHIAESSRAKDLRAIGRPSWIYELPGSIRKLAHIASVAVHHKQLKRILDASGKNDALAIGRPRGPAVQISFSRHTVIVGAIGIHDEDLG